MRCAVAEYEVLLVVVPDIHQFLGDSGWSNAVVGHHHACHILGVGYLGTHTARRHTNSQRLRLAILDKLHTEVVLVVTCGAESQRLVGSHLIRLIGTDLLHQNIAVARTVFLETVELHATLDHVGINRIVEGQYPRLIGSVRTITLVGNLIDRYHSRTIETLTVSERQRRKMTASCCYRIVTQNEVRSCYIEDTLCIDRIICPHLHSAVRLGSIQSGVFGTNPSTVVANFTFTDRIDFARIQIR